MTPSTKTTGARGQDVIVAEIVVEPITIGKLLAVLGAAGPHAQATVILVFVVASPPIMPSTVAMPFISSGVTTLT